MVVKTMKPEEAKPVKYFVGALFSSEELLKKSLEDLEQKFSKIDLSSEDFPFNVTIYYNSEMGSPIFRRICSFSDLISPSYLADAKLTSNSTEDKYRINNKRKVNLDIGYMDYDKVVLASAKYGTHKIYIYRGIYADMALHYEKGNFSPYTWAFMDFKLPLYYDFFLKIREIYKAQLKSLK
ncbi:MAG: DUF4416 family protein [Candidatus Marinimicrobia bacterium]|nr:DUF4416 family protein [Candidatus Neomarinimicrobiota bacterium]